MTKAGPTWEPSCTRAAGVLRYWLCLLQHQRPQGNPPANCISNNNPLGILCLRKNSLEGVLLGSSSWEDCKRQQKPAGLRTSCFSKIPANCCWFLVSLAVPYPEVFLVSLTITWPRAVVGFICVLKAHLKWCWHFSRENDLLIYWIMCYTVTKCQDEQLLWKIIKKKY